MYKIVHKRKLGNRYKINAETEDYLETLKIKQQDSIVGSDVLSHDNWLELGKEFDTYSVMTIFNIHKFIEIKLSKVLTLR